MAEQKASTSIEAVESGLAAQGYIASRQIATAVYLSQQIEKPILVEGPAGVGKTELAKAIAAWRGMKMIRLQCYEGLDEAKALYEWKYAKQLLYTQILKDKLGEVLGGAQTLHAALDAAARFRRRVLLQGIRRAAAAAAGAGAAGRLRAADRRDRQVGCRVRIAAAGNPLRFPGHDPGARHGRGDHAADGDPHLQQRARPRRRPEAALPASAYRLPRAAARRTHRREPRPRHLAGAAPADGRLHPRDPLARPEEAAFGQRDHRLGARAGATSGHGARPRHRQGHAQRAPEIRGRYRGATPQVTTFIAKAARSNVFG